MVIDLQVHHTVRKTLNRLCHVPLPPNKNWASNNCLPQTNNFS